MKIPWQLCAGAALAEFVFAGVFLLLVDQHFGYQEAAIGAEVAQLQRRTQCLFGFRPAAKLIEHPGERDLCIGTFIVKPELMPANSRARCRLTGSAWSTSSNAS